MTFEYIFSTADAEARSNFNPESHLSGAIVATGKNQELVWAKFEPGGTYSILTQPLRTGERDVAGSHVAHGSRGGLRDRAR